MTNSTQNTTPCSTDRQVDLTLQDELGGISVNPECFARFDARMTSAIEELQTRWVHKAAPADVVAALRYDRRLRS